MRRKTVKELGTPTVQAAALANKVVSLPAEELLKRAVAERQRLTDAGQLDDVTDNQPDDPPARDESLVGTMLELRWRYWEKVNDAAGKDKRKKRAVDIW